MLNVQFDDAEMRRAGQRELSRDQLHRILKAYGIPHDPGEIRSVMEDLMAKHNIPRAWPPAARVEEVKKRGRPKKHHG